MERCGVARADGCVADPGDLARTEMLALLLRARGELPVSVEARCDLCGGACCAVLTARSVAAVLAALPEGFVGRVCGREVYVPPFTTTPPVVATCPGRLAVRVTEA